MKKICMLLVLCICFVVNAHNDFYPRIGDNLPEPWRYSYLTGTDNLYILLTENGVEDYINIFELNQDKKIINFVSIITMKSKEEAVHLYRIIVEQLGEYITHNKFKKHETYNEYKVAYKGKSKDIAFYTTLGYSFKTNQCYIMTLVLTNRDSALKKFYIDSDIPLLEFDIIERMEITDDTTRD